MTIVPLHISRLRPHLANLNLVLEDYGVCVVVTVNAESEYVIIEDGKALVTIGEPKKWIVRKD